MKKLLLIGCLSLCGKLFGQTFKAGDYLTQHCQKVACVEDFLKVRGFTKQPPQGESVTYLSNTKFNQKSGSLETNVPNVVFIKMIENGTALQFRFMTVSASVYNTLEQELISLGFKPEQTAFTAAAYKNVIVRKETTNSKPVDGVTFKEYWLTIYHIITAEDPKKGTTEQKPAVPVKTGAPAKEQIVASSGITGPALKEVNSFPTDHFSNHLEFSGNGQWLVNVVGFNADVYEAGADGFRFIQKLSGGRWQAFYPGVSEDGGFIAFSNFEQTFIYKRESGKYSLIQTLLHPGKSGNHDIIMRFTGNDKLMIVGGEGNIRYYEWKTDKFIEVARIIYEGGLQFQEAALSPDGKRLATLDENGMVCCWQINDRTAIPGPPLLNINKYLGILDISNDLLLAAGSQDSLNVYKLSADLKSFRKLHAMPAGAYGQVSFNPDGNRLIVARNEALEVYTVTETSIQPDGSIHAGAKNFTSIRASQDRKWLAASISGNKVMKVFNAPVPLPVVKQVGEKQKAANKPAGSITKPATPAKTKVPAKITTARAIPYLKKTGKYVLVDSVSLKQISATEYDEIGDDNEGLTIVMANKKYGYIDRTGKEVIPLKYGYAKIFKGGISCVMLNGKWGCIDKNDKEVIPISSETSHDFIEGVSKFKKNGLFGFINSKGEVVVSPKYKEARDFSEGLALVDPADKPGRFFIDQTGKEVLSFGPGHGISSFKGGLATVFKNIGQTWLIDKTGKDLLNKKYTQITLSEGGVAILNVKAVYNEIKIEGKFGMVDKEGKEILPVEYDYIGSFGDDIFLVVKDNAGWCINRSGVKLFDFNYQRRQDFAEGKAAVLKDGKWGYINKAGKEIIPAKYEDISGTFSEGLANVKFNGKWGFIDGTGKVVIPFRYSSPYGGFKKGLAKLKEKEGYQQPWFFVSKKGVEYREK